MTWLDSLTFNDKNTTNLLTISYSFLFIHIKIRVHQNDDNTVTLSSLCFSFICQNKVLAQNFCYILFLNNHRVHGP